MQKRIWEVTCLPPPQRRWVRHCPGQAAADGAATSESGSVEGGPGHSTPIAKGTPSTGCWCRAAVGRNSNVEKLVEKFVNATIL